MIISRFVTGFIIFNAAAIYAKIGMSSHVDKIGHINQYLVSNLIAIFNEQYTRYIIVFGTFG